MADGQGGGADKKNVVVLLPGLAGSELLDGNETIWPGKVLDFIFGYPEEKLQKLINNPLTVGNIIGHVSVVTIYDSLIKTLQDLGYTEKQKNLVLFPFDWRVDLVTVAGAVADKLDQISHDLGNNCSITLLGHSTGGLISRYLLESGKFKGRPGMAAVSQLITMGTAGRGAPEALAGILGLARLVFLNPQQAARLAAATKFPAAYQHMPAPGTTALWDVHPGSQPRDLYADDVVRTLGLDPAHVMAAKDYWSTLHLPADPWSGVRYFAFVGSHKSTKTGFAYDDSKHGGAAATPVETDDGGDSVVPIWSADPGSLQVEFVGGSHMTLFDDAGLKSRLSQLLPPGAGQVRRIYRVRTGAIDASVRNLVFAADSVEAAQQPIVVSLSVGENVTPAGDIVIEAKHPIGRDAPQSKVAAWLRSKYWQVKKIPISLPPAPPRYQGVSIGKVGDFEPGQYRAYFVVRGKKTPSGQCAEFFVQAAPHMLKPAKRAAAKGGRAPKRPIRRRKGGRPR
jgi:hypothetical protein